MFVALITAIGVIFQNIQLAFLLLLMLVELVGLIVKKCRKYAKEKKKSHSTA